MYGTRMRKDLCFLDELRSYEKKFADLKFIPVFSEANDDLNWQCDRCLVTEAIERWAENGSVQAYLCGPPPIIDAGLLALASVGVPDEEISLDKFLSKADFLK